MRERIYSMSESTQGPELFNHEPKYKKPLAELLRPQALEDIVGQPHLVGPSGVLRKLVASNRLESIILWGPAGTGKTTIAQLLGKQSKAYFIQLSASQAGTKDIKNAEETAKRLLIAGQRTILFADEIHRWNKTQLGALLPAVENGTLILVGATTENPYFEINGPLLSRCILLRLLPLTEEDLFEVIRRGLEQLGASSSDTLSHELASMANGDARQALNLLEMAYTSATLTQDTEHPVISIDDLAQTGALAIHQMGQENLYDERAAWIQSMNGSDPDAAIYWLVRLLAGGESPVYLARRLMVLAAEDIGQADPTALLVAAATSEAVRVVGLPECELPLAQATIHLACAPKSNKSAMALWSAKEYVRSHPDYAVPPVNRSREHPFAKDIGSGIGYRYPHDQPGAVSYDQPYLPEEVAGTVFYQPTHYGAEHAVAERLERIKQGLGHESHNASDNVSDGWGDI